VGEPVGTIEELRSRCLSSRTSTTTIGSSSVMGTRPRLRSGKNNSCPRKGPRENVLPGVQLLLTDAGSMSSLVQGYRDRVNSYRTARAVYIWSFRQSCRGRVSPDM